MNDQKEIKYTEEIDLVDYMKILLEQRKIIIINVSIVTLLSLILSFIMPKTYTSFTVLMPPYSESRGDIFGALDYIPFGGIFPQSTDESLSIIAILKSRTLMESVIKRFDLINFYNSENMEYALESLASNLEIEIEEEETIRISVDVSTVWFHPDVDEKKAKTLSTEMAKYIVKQLDIINKNLKIEQASFHRKFIENRHTQTIKVLGEAEDSLRIFQEKHNIISLEAQTDAAIETAADINEQILVKSVHLEIKEKNLSPQHHEIILLKNELSSLQNQLNKMENSSNNVSVVGQRRLFPPFSDIPEIGTALTRLEREIEVQSALFLFLTQQYEEAKIEESKDTPTVQILDDAAIPDRHSSPKRVLIVVISFLLSLVINILYVFYNEDIKNKDKK